MDDPFAARKGGIVSADTWDDALRDAAETLEWIKDWREGQFTPARTDDGWSVEMHGLVDSAAKIAEALLEAPGRIAHAASGEITTLNALDQLVKNGVPYDVARDLIDHAKAAGKAMGDFEHAQALGETWLRLETAE